MNLLDEKNTAELSKMKAENIAMKEEIKAEMVA